MIQTRLRAFLDSHDLSVYQLANAVAEETNALSETSIYKIASGQRNPSLASLDLILTALTRLTGKHVDLSELLEFIPESTDELVLETPRDDIDEIAMVWELARPKVRWLPKASAEDQPSGVHPPPPIATVNRSRSKIGVLIALAGILILVVVSGALLYNRPSTQPTGADALAEGVGLEPPVLLAVTATSLTPTLQVERLEQASEYEFQLRNNDSGRELITTAAIEPAFKVPPTYLCPGITYAWTARMRTPAGWSGQASPASFMIRPTEESRAREPLPPPPSALGPSGTVMSLTPTLRLSKVTSARHYGFYVRDLESDTLVYINEFSPIPSHRLPDGLLKPDTRYRWNGQARNCAGFSDYSQQLDFRTQAVSD